MNPRFPLYIVSKGRAHIQLTMRALDRIHVPYHVVVEQQEFDEYAGTIGASKLLVLDDAYKRNYETCDALGLSKSTGSGPARNFAWDHSIANGHAWHWVMDDNIRRFQRLHRNERIQFGDGSGFHCMEEFCLRYTNLAMAGPNYETFAHRRSKHPPFVKNTRIYSCNLIRNDVPFRWRGRLNEDTILSIDMLKAGWCTVLFNAFLQVKTWTMVCKGGNTDEFYANEGTYNKSKLLADVHPDVSRVIHRFRRAHHYVDYSTFKTKLRRRPNVDRDKVFDMKIVPVEPVT